MPAALIYILIALLVIGLAYVAIRFIWFRPITVGQFFTRAILHIMLDGPEVLTMVGLLERVGINFHNARLSDISQKSEAKQAALLKRLLATLRSYPRARQNRANQLSMDILDWFLEDEVRAEPFRYHDYPVNQMFGQQSEFPNFMTSMHPMDGRANARNYIKRLHLAGWRFGHIIEGLQARQANGCLPPRFVLQRVLTEMTEFVATPPCENVLYTVFARKLDRLKLNAEEKKRLLDGVQDAIQGQVYPAYQKLIEVCQGLERATNDDDGVWKLPSGEAYYAYQLRSNTTTELSAAQIHDLGLREVARIEQEMHTILERLGELQVEPDADAPGVELTPIARRMVALGKEARFLYPNTDEGRAACLEDYQKILDEISQRIAPLFDLRPKAGLKVQRVPEFRQKTAPGAYYQSADMGGGRPGVFYANLRDMNEVPKFGMKTLAYHEGIPGHHFQIAIAMGLRGLPFFRRMIPFTAYAEGWALYAEKLVREQGAYQDDPYGELGCLASELFRAVRLVVDTGIHDKRWTRQQAIDYMIAHTGQPMKSVVSEIERYIVRPGQACAYKIGELKIIELRQKAQKALGEKFSLPQFHRNLLQNGAMPLQILEQVVDAYIAQAGG